MAKGPGHPGWKALTAVARSSGLFLFLLLAAPCAVAGDVTLAWDPAPSPPVTGYQIYYGPAAGNYPSKVDVGNATTYTVSGLVEGATYHFAATRL